MTIPDDSELGKRSAHILIPKESTGRRSLTDFLSTPPDPATKRMAEESIQLFKDYPSQNIVTPVEQRAQTMCEDLRKLQLPISITNQHGWVRSYYLGGKIPDFVPQPKVTRIVSLPSQAVTAGEWLKFLDYVEELYAFAPH